MTASFSLPVALMPHEIRRRTLGAAHGLVVQRGDTRFSRRDVPRAEHGR